VNPDPTPNARHGARIARLVVLMACALLAALAIPSAASAARGLLTGFADPEEYQAAPPDQRNIWFDRTVDAGGGIVRLAVEWYDIAPPTARPADPTNPGSTSYDFSAVDGGVRDAAAHGLQVLLTVNHAPPWAEGPGRPADAPAGSWRPNPQDLADFTQALASRYTGNFDPDGVGPQPPLPFVEGIQVWNEPNSSDWLAPQFEGRRIVGGTLYRDMLNAAYRTIKQVNPRMQVVTGGTDPYGDPPGGPYPPNVQRTRPVQFWEQALCVRGVKSKKKKKGKSKKKGTAPTKFVRSSDCTGRANFDIFAHHPIDNTGGGPLKSGPNRYDASTPDLGRVVAVLRGAEKLGTISGGKHPVWVTEFWWDSKPPNSAGAPLQTQARWIEQSMYLFWKAGASAAISFQIADSTLRSNERAGLQAAPYFRDGQSKPSLTAFKFPFVTERINMQKLKAWGKAPEAGQLRIQRQQGNRWRNVKKLQVTKGGVFLTTLKLSGKQRLRATVGSSQSIVWKQAQFGAKNSNGGGGGGPSTPLIIVLLAGGLALIVAGTTVIRRRQLHQRRQLQQQRHHGPRPITG
jgi:hypothetical protein